HAHSIVGEILDGIARLTRSIARRSAGVAMIVSDHVTASAGELTTEVLRPPDARGHGTHDQENGWIARVAECFGIEGDAVRVDLMVSPDVRTVESLRSVGSSYSP